MVKNNSCIDLNVTPFLDNIDDTKSNISDHTVTELNEVNLENKKLKEMLILARDNNFLQNQDNQSMQERGLLKLNPNKRKLKELAEFNKSVCTDGDQAGSSKRQKNIAVTRVYSRTDPSDKSMVVKDEYKWRKYGQKVTKDSQTPRAYYKCSRPSCPVKKKVHRSVEDDSLLVTIYEGEHNHHKSMDQNEHIKNTIKERCNFPSQGGNYGDEVLVEKMANSLRRDPDFIEKLVEAVASKILKCNFNLF